MISILFPTKTLQHRATIEDPNTPLAFPDDDTLEAFGSSKTAGGVRVTRDSALTYSAVWKAVTLISRDVAKLPIIIYRRVGEGKERNPDHPLWRVLRRKVNPVMTTYQFVMAMQASALLNGNGYAWIERRSDGSVNLWPIQPDLVTPEFRDRTIIYRIRNSDAGERIFRSDEILHLRGLGDGYVGISVISKARDSLSVGIAAMRYGARFFRNSARPGVVLEHPGHLSPEAAKRIRKSWNEMYSGVDNAHKAAVLEEGMQLKILGLTNEDAQFLETRQFELREVANWFGVPPHKLGDTTRTSFASLEQENQSYLDEAIDPWLVAWEAELYDKLLTEAEKRAESTVIEFLRQALVRANLTDRASFYNLGIQGGWLSRDEVRARENLNPIPDGEGSKFFVPLNVSLTGDQDDEPAEPDDEPRAIDVTPILEQLTDRAVARISRQAQDAAKSGAEQFRSWLSELEAKNNAVVMELFDAVARSIGKKYLAHTAASIVFVTTREELEPISELHEDQIPTSVTKATERIRGRVMSLMKDAFKL